MKSTMIDIMIIGGSREWFGNNEGLGSSGISYGFGVRAKGSGRILGLATRVLEFVG